MLGKAGSTASKAGGIAGKVGGWQGALQKGANVASGLGGQNQQGINSPYVIDESGAFGNRGGSARFGGGYSGVAGYDDPDEQQYGSEGLPTTGSRQFPGNYGSSSGGAQNKKGGVSGFR